MRNSLFLIVSLSILLLITGCIGNGEISKQREAFAQAGSGDLVIAVPGPIEYMKELTGFHNGISMAIDEINEGGGINGVSVQAMFEDDNATFSDGIRLAQDIAMQADVVAVIGHWNTFITLPAARVYNDAGVLLLSPVVSNPDLTKQGYEYVFQNIVNDFEMGRQMADYAKELGYERIVVFYADNDYGRGLSNSFESFVNDNGGLIVDRMTDFVNEQEFNRSQKKWEALDYDAVFIADSMPHAGEFIKRFRQKDSETPIFAGDGLDFGDISAALGEDAEGIVIASMYNPEKKSEPQEKFVEAYVSLYDVEPDVWAIQGYDSINLLAYAMKKAETASPSVVAKVLRTDEEWQGVLGAAEFNSNGEMIGRTVYKKIVRNGKMEYLEN